MRTMFPIALPSYNMAEIKLICYAAIDKNSVRLSALNRVLIMSLIHNQIINALKKSEKY